MLNDTTRLLPVEGFRVLRKLVPAVEPAPSPPPVDDSAPAPTTSRIICSREEIRTDLTRLMAITFDVLAGRRPDSMLRHLNVADRVRTGLATRLRRGGEKGACVMSLHPDVRSCGNEVHFVGSWSSDRGIRAFAGRADRKSGDGPWSITALRLL